MIQYGRTTKPEPAGKNLRYRDDYIGMKFGSLTVIAYPLNNDGVRTGGCICQCECGAEVLVYSMGELLSGRRKYCRECRRKRLKETTTEFMRDRLSEYTACNYEFRGERLFKIWRGMRERCENASNRSYEYYGAKGVSVCDEWHDYRIFREWALSHGFDESLPRRECSIDRINPYGNYEPANCRWANAKTQGNNQRCHWDKLSERERQAELETAGTYVRR